MWVIRYVLQHKETGKYFAWRVHDEEDCGGLEPVIDLDDDLSPDFFTEEQVGEANRLAHGYPYKDLRFNARNAIDSDDVAITRVDLTYRQGEEVSLP